MEIENAAPDRISKRVACRSHGALLAKEKEFTRLRDLLSSERCNLPWVKVEKQHVFDGPNGKETLADLFDGRSQLIVKHFILGPGWTEGCVGCSFELDHIDAILVHLEHRDVSYVAVSRAPLPEIETFKDRMGWRVKWVSSFGSDFNYDFHVSFKPDDIANSKVYYNYAMRSVGSEELSGRSVFTRTQTAMSFTPTHPTDAAARICSVPIGSSTSCQRAATRLAPIAT